MRDSHVLVIYHQSVKIAFYVPGYFVEKILQNIFHGKY